jgi:nickel/cobalt transporter (NiCoT) family protein
LEAITLFILVFVLGMRHGLDADHLACIDGLVRYNWRIRSPYARWVGTLFSLGHGLVVAGVAAILGLVTSHFTFPTYFDTVVTWISVISLFIIGTMNTMNLLRKPVQEEGFQLQGLKGRFIPRAAKETKNPFLIVLIGGIFALAADTISQTSVWALAAGSSGNLMPVLLGLTFMVGMVLTDTLDSLIAHHILDRSGQMGRTASRVMGWFIVAIAYGVSFYEAFTFFVPDAEVDFEIVGVLVFVSLLALYVYIRLRKHFSHAPSNER